MLYSIAVTDASPPLVPPFAAPVLPGELSNRVGFLLSQLGAQTARRFAERLAPLGVKPSHYGLIVLLAEEEGRSQQQIADSLGIHRNAMVGLVDDLERRGFIERKRHPADRRAHAIHLTDAARELLPEVRALAGEQEEELLAGVGAEDRERLTALLQRLVANAGNRPGVHPGLADG